LVFAFSCFPRTLFLFIIHGDRLRGAGGKAIAIGRGRRPGQFAIARIAVVVIRRLRLLAVLLQRNLWQ